MIKKLIVLALAVAALAVSSGSAASSGSPKSAIVKPARGKAVLHSRYDSRSGGIAYRLGDSGLWMN